MLRFGAFLVVAAVLASWPSTELPTFSRDPEDFQLLARAEGDLLMDANGCILLAGEDGATMLLAWPAGTRFEGRRLQLGETAARIGSHIAVGGGEGISPQAGSGWANPPSDACWRPRRWVVHALDVIRY